MVVPTEYKQTLRNGINLKLNIYCSRDLELITMEDVKEALIRPDKNKIVIES